MAGRPFEAEASLVATGGERLQKTDEWVLPQVSRNDVLFVVDDGASLGDFEGSRLAAAQGYLDYLSAQTHVPWRIYATTTDGSGQLRTAADGRSFIDADTADAAAALAALLTVQTPRVGPSLGLASMEAAVASGAMVSPTDRPRDLAVKVLSGREDSSPDPIVNYALGLVAAAGGTGGIRFVSFDYFAVPEGGCNTPGTGYLGDRYAQVADRLEGSVATLYGQSWSRYFEDFERDYSETWYGDACAELSMTPVADTLEVYADDTLVPSLDTAGRPGYELTLLRRTVNQVCLSPWALPAPESRVRFRYQPVCPN